jgi:hypothetical protein
VWDFLSLSLAFQQVQVYRKQKFYALSIAFFSLEVLSVLYVGRFHTSLFLLVDLLLFLEFYGLRWIESLFLAVSKSRCFT